MPILLDAVTLALLALFGWTSDSGAYDCTLDPATGVTVCVCDPARWTP